MNTDILIYRASLKLGLEKDYPVGTPFWHVHHDQILEELTEPLSHRIIYMLGNKPKNELDVRLALISPVQDIESLRRYQSESYLTSSKYHNYESDINRLHSYEHGNCPWNGVTIFSAGYKVPSTFRIRGAKS